MITVKRFNILSDNTENRICKLTDGWSMTRIII